MQYRDIDWYVNFEIYINGERSEWEDLTDEERRKILDDIESDYYYGTFVYEGYEDYDPDETEKNENKNKNENEEKEEY